MIDRTLQFSLGFINLCQIFKDTCALLKKHFNINENETRLLLVTYADKPPAIKHLSKKLSLSAALTSKVLLSLENKGLITRQLSDADKRKEKVILTDKGIRITCMIIEFIQNAVCKGIVNSLSTNREDLFVFSETVKTEISKHKTLTTNLITN